MLLIDAFTQLKQQNDNVRLILVGNGLIENKIKERLSQLPLNIESSIIILPFQDQHQMKLLYRVANVFILPSKSETWGLCVNEALASGTPVIVSDKCGSSKDLVKNEVNGLVFKSDIRQDLFLKMQEMCNDDFRERIASKAQESLKHYSYASFLTALGQIFHRGEN
jgi:glycosyltransferase involved in cell wall biosynthesis